MPNLQTYVIETEATSMHGCQRWAVKAADEGHALHLYARGVGVLLEQDIEVTDLGPPEVVGVLSDPVPEPAGEEASELEYLRFFYSNIDCGPAHEEVVAIIEEGFTRETGKAVPANYKIGG